MNVSEEHVALVELFRCHPRLAVTLVLRSEGLAPPDGWTCRVVDPVDHGARRTSDTTILVEGPGGVRILVTVLEVQLRREPLKRRRFASYLWLAQDRWDCDGYLLVVSPRRSVARWACQPLLVGGSVTRLLAVGPDEVPRITDITTALADPPLAVLSAAMHGAGPDGDAVLHAAFAALRTLPEADTRYYSSLVADRLSPERLRELEETDMHTQRSVRTAHRARLSPAELERAHALLRKWRGPEFGEYLQGVLLLQSTLLRQCERRGFVVPEARRAEVKNCINLGRLEGWLDRVVTAARVEEVFE